MGYLSPQTDYTPPPLHIVKFLSKLVHWYFSPTFYGIEHIDGSKPALFVSNHTLLGLTDGPLYIPELYEKKNLYLRVLVDNMHQSIPVWRSILTDYGAVSGSREHCNRLMEQRQSILVFPGGTNEICKKKGDEYKLIWKKRYGFARMAIEHGYPIVTISALGGDELYDILVDKEEIMDSFLGKILQSSGIADTYLKAGENIPPIVKGIGPTLIPKPHKIYYQFSKPISTSSYKGNASEENLVELRSIVEKTIYDGIHDLQDARSNDDEEPIRNFFSHL